MVFCENYWMLTCLAILHIYIALVNDTVQKTICINAYPHQDAWGVITLPLLYNQRHTHWGQSDRMRDLEHADKHHSDMVRRYKLHADCLPGANRTTGPGIEMQKSKSFSHCAIHLSRLWSKLKCVWYNTFHLYPFYYKHRESSVCLIYSTVLDPIVVYLLET